MVYVAKIDGGCVKLYSSTGSYQRTIGDYNAVSASVQGDTVAITYADGRVKIYSTSGSYQRTL